MCSAVLGGSVVSDSCDPIDCGLPGSCPWDSPGKNTGVGCHFILQGIFLTQESNPGLLHCKQILYHLSHQGSPCIWPSGGGLGPESCLILATPMDCSPSGSSVREIFQARILEWVAISFSRGSSQPRDRTQVSCTASRFFTM